MKLGAAMMAAALLAVGAMAQTLPTFKTMSAAGATNAWVVFPQGPNSQVRVVSALSTSDLSTGTLTFYSGTTARYVTIPETNATILYLDNTNGLVAGGYIYVQGTTSNWVALVTSYTTTNAWAGTGTTITNVYGVVTPSMQVPVTQALNAEVEVLGNSVTINTGAKTNQMFASDAVYVGNYGRAVYAVQTGTANAALPAISAHYDGYSQ